MTQYLTEAATRTEAITRLLAMIQHDGDPLDISLADRRAGMAALATFNPPADDVVVRTEALGGLPATSVSAPGAGDAVLLHVHGGGYIAGEAANYLGVLGELSRHSGRRAVSFDYRLAPEHPFPAAVDDALAAYRACLDGAKDVAVVGDSAGGGLALAMLLRARAEGLAMPAGAALFSPWADLTGLSPAYQSKRDDDPMIDPRLARDIAGRYLAGADARDPLASPALADLSGMPPLLIQVGSREVLLDDSLAIDAASRRAGGSVTLEVWPEMVHVWHVFMSELPQAREAVARAGTWLRTPR